MMTQFVVARRIVARSRHANGSDEYPLSG